ncbi:MAG TPA: hypothetical protein DDW22_03695 [Prevotellaceae bacterium]|nr:hypothetical protein [Prevotellaceae bacterium]
MVAGMMAGHPLDTAGTVPGGNWPPGIGWGCVAQQEDKAEEQALKKGGSATGYRIVHVHSYLIW